MEIIQFLTALSSHSTGLIMHMAKGNHLNTSEIPMNVSFNRMISDPLSSTSASIQWDLPPTCGHCVDCGYFVTVDGGITSLRNTGSSGSPTHELRGLSPFTMYSIQVRAECTDGGRTPYSIPFNFTTDKAGHHDNTNMHSHPPHT